LSEVHGIEIMKLQRSEKDPVIEMLQNTPLWSGLSSQDLKLIVKLSKERGFESGQTIVSKGEGGIGFYLILAGTVEVRSDGNVLSKLGLGQFFGEMSVLDNQPRSADVVAVEPSRVLILSAWSFKTLISDNPKIALKMLQEFVRRLRNTDKSLSD
jgi:CRP/FNR family transcriptional regulator, cyclic AMP receptor protein